MSTTTPGRDEQRLAELGYSQDLNRAWSGFSNFAISFTIISILAGCLTSYYIAFGQGGAVAVSWGWLLVGGMSIIVSLAMAEIASAFPTAGGLYYWASKLGSPAWGWFTGWFNLIGQIAVTAAIGYGLATIGPGIGVALIFAAVINGTARQPEARGALMGTAWIGFAVVEALAIIGIALAFVLTAGSTS